MGKLPDRDKFAYHCVNLITFCGVSLVAIAHIISWQFGTSILSTAPTARLEDRARSDLVRLADRQKY